MARLTFPLCWTGLCGTGLLWCSIRFCRESVGFSREYCAEVSACKSLRPRDLRRSTCSRLQAKLVSHEEKYRQSDIAASRKLTLRFNLRQVALRARESSRRGSFLAGTGAEDLLNELLHQFAIQNIACACPLTCTPNRIFHVMTQVWHTSCVNC